jgi:hypothetical protein
LGVVKVGEVESTIAPPLMPVVPFERFAADSCSQ